MTTRGTDLDPVVRGDRVDVWDDVAQASSVLDAMQGSLDPSTVVYKLAPHHCWCAVVPETAVGERDLARWAGTELAKQRDEARAQLAEARQQLSEPVERNLSHLAVIKQVGAERDDLRDQLEDVDAGRVERGAQRDSALLEAKQSQKRLRIIKDALREARVYESRLRAECNVLAAKLDLSREETAVIARVGGINREGYLSQYPIVAEREALDAALAAYEVARKSAPSPVDGPTVGSVRETYAPLRGQLYDGSGVPCPDIEQHPLVVAAYTDRDAMRAQRDDALAERDKAVKELSLARDQRDGACAELSETREGRSAALRLMDVTEAERDEVKRKYADLVGRHRTVVQEREVALREAASLRVYVDVDTARAQVSKLTATCEALRSEIGEARAEAVVARRERDDSLKVALHTDVMRSDVENAEIDREIQTQRDQARARLAELPGARRIAAGDREGPRAS